eukprot:scaffold37055_cov44-Attheya_sp.AAC.1
MGGHGGNGEVPKTCGLTELLIFIAAILAGTACSICSKTMMELKSIGMTGEEEVFTKPLFQTFGMFVGMTFGLLMHWAVVHFSIPFPGYTASEQQQQQRLTLELEQTRMEEAHKQNKSNQPPPLPSMATETDRLLTGGNAGKSRLQSIQSGVSLYEDNENDVDPMKLPTWMYFFLAIPSIFDLGATMLCMMGLRYIDVSIYQMLRGSGIIFVALMKQHVLKDVLYRFQWVGVFGNVTSVFFVGTTAILASKAASQDVDDDTTGGAGSGEAFLGVLLVMAGAFVQSLQFVFEEKVMTMDIPSPPLLLIGMEGLWGTVLCVFVLYPMAYYLPGEDHGSYENAWNTYEMICNSSTIQSFFIIYFIAIFLYNLFAVLVTFLLNSVWHAILDNFRPITVWSTDLFIYYVISQTGDLGEAWTKWSFVQLAGMFVLFYGTAIYNAPNAGSIQLRGQWWGMGLDFSSEYEEMEEARIDAEWEAKRVSLVTRTASSFMGERNVHTQALYGLASPHI